MKNIVCLVLIMNLIGYSLQANVTHGQGSQKKEFKALKKECNAIIALIKKYQKSNSESVKAKKGKKENHEKQMYDLHQTINQRFQKLLSSTLFAVDKVKHEDAVNLMKKISLVLRNIKSLPQEILQKLSFDKLEHMPVRVFVALLSTPLGQDAKQDVEKEGISILKHLGIDIFWDLVHILEFVIESELLGVSPESLFVANETITPWTHDVIDDLNDHRVF